LQDAAARLRDGHDAETALAASRTVLQANGLAVDYLALVDGPSLRQIETLQSDARLIAAARLGSVRLLDNIDPG
jgi:pantoate--beta-alanine ligase